MPKKHAVVLVDEGSRVEIPMYFIGETKLEIEQVHEDITKSTFTPEEKASMLSYLMHEAKAVLSEEETATMFPDIEESIAPSSISVNKENYALIYKALEQIASLQECSPEPTPIKEDEPTIPVESAPEVTTEEPTTPDVIENAIIEEPKEDVTPVTEPVVEPEVIEESDEVKALKAKIADQDALIETLRTDLVSFKSQERDSKLNGIVDMLIEMEKPIAVKYNNEVSEILASIVTRTQESLDDLYEDLVCEYEAYTEDATPVVPEVLDPTVGVPEAAKLDEVTTQLHGVIEESELDMEVYNVLVGKDAVARIVQAINTK